MKWTDDVSLTITPHLYKMGWVHRYICEAIKGLNEIKKVYFVEDFLKLTEHSGLAIFDEHLIYVANDIDYKEKKIALIHEIFHYYFRDYDGAPIEPRVENSALNVLEWYEENKKQSNEFENLFKNIKLKHLSNDELDLL